MKTLVTEEWMDHPSYPLYKVSNHGRIIYKPTGAIKTCKENKDGHLEVRVSLDGKKKMVTLKKLVAECFLKNKRGLPNIGFYDGDKNNCSAENLFYYGKKKPRPRKSNEVSENINRDRAKSRYKSMTPEEKEVYKKNATMWQKENMVRYRFLSARNRAIKRQMDFNISEVFINEKLCEQNYQCFYSGLPIKDNFSLDRVDSSKGYIIENVVMVDPRINYMKQDLPYDEFLDLVRNIFQFSCENVMV